MGVYTLSRNRQREIQRAFEEAYGVKDKETKAQNTLRVDYYRSYLWRLFVGSVGIEIPEYWSIDYFRYAYLFAGHVAFAEINGVVVPFWYGVKTMNGWKYMDATK